MCAEKQNNDQNQGDINASEGKTEGGAGRDIPNAGRRKFLKLGLAGAGAVAVVGGGITAVKRMEGLPHDDFPLPVRDDFKRIDQRNQINVFAGSKALNEKHPERNRSFSEQLKKENPQGFKPFHFYETRSKFMKNPYRDTPGYTQLERALAVGGFSSTRQQLGGGQHGSAQQGSIQLEAGDACQEPIPVQLS